MKNCYSILLTLFLVFSLNVRATVYDHAASKKDWTNPMPWTTTTNGVESVYSRLLNHHKAVSTKTVLAPTITLNVTTDGCKNGGRIEVATAGTTGQVLYQLDGPTPFPQGTSNIFDGLTSGNYTVKVWDGSTGGTPVTKTVTITNNFIDLDITNVSVSNNLSTLPVCAPRGIITVTAVGGKAPLKYSLLNQATGTLIVDFASQTSNVFTGVPPGTYSVLVLDACNNEVRSGDSGITVSDYDDISKATSLTTTLLITGYRNSNDVYFSENSTCDQTTVSFVPGTTFWKYTLTDVSGNVLKINPKDVLYRIKAPNGNWSSWVASDQPATVNYTLNTNNDVDFVFEFQSGCNTNLTTSATYTYNGFHDLYFPVYYKDADNCNFLPIDHIRTNAEWQSDALLCLPITVKIVDVTAGGTVLANKTFTTKWLAAGYSVSNSETTGFISGHVLEITMTDAKGLFVTKQMTVPDLALPNMITDGNIVSYPNSNNCDFTGVKYSFYGSSGKNIIPNGPYPVTYKIISGPGAGTSVTVLNATDKNPDGSLKITAPFGTYLPYGNYTIQIDFGDTGTSSCRTMTFNYNITQRVSSLRLGNVTTPTNVTNCKTYAVNIPYSYTDATTGAPLAARTDKADGVWITLTNTDGSGNGDRTVYSYNSTNYTFTGVNPGTYTITIAPYDGTVGAAPTCLSDSKTITLAPYAIPVIDVPHSGGLVCSPATNGDLTVVATGINLKYAYKKQGAADATYSANQTNNVFSSLPIGFYTVRVTDGCGYTITQDLTVASSDASIFSGAAQTICPGTTATITTTPIGAVTNYKWTLPDGAVQQGADLYQLVIPNFTAVKNGVYIVTATNPVGCTVTSTIKLTAATDLNLVVTNPATVCAGTTVNLANAASGVASYIYYAADQTTVLATPMVTPLVTTDYYVQGTSGSGCVLPKQKITVTVNPAPALVITNPAPVVTAGATVNLTASTITAGSTNVVSLDYYEDVACTIPVATPSAVSISSNKTYYIKATAVGGCTDIKPVTITTLFPTVTITGTNGSCQKDCTVALNTTSWTVGTSATYTLTDYTTGLPVYSGVTTSTFVGLFPGTYTITVYDSSTGLSGVTSAPVTVTSSYVPLQLTAISVTNGTSCAGNGTISYGSKFGTSPVQYWIESTGYTSPVQTNSLGTVTFTGVPPGTYKVYAKDACNTTLNENDIKVTGVDYTGFDNVKIWDPEKYFDRGTTCDKLAINIAHLTPHIGLYNGTTKITTVDPLTLSYKLEFSSGTPAVTSSYDIVQGQTSQEVGIYVPFTPTKYRVKIWNPCSSAYVDSEWIDINDPKIAVDVSGDVITDMCTTGGLVLNVQWDTKPCFPINPIKVKDVNAPYTEYTFGPWTDSSQVQFPLTGVPPGTYDITATDAEGHTYTIASTVSGTSYTYTPISQNASISVSQGCTIGESLNLRVTGILSSVTSPSSFPITYTITSGPAGTIGKKFTQTTSDGIYGNPTIFENLPAGNYTIKIAYADNGVDTPCRTQDITLEAKVPLLAYDFDKLGFTGCFTTHSIYGSLFGKDENGNVFNQWNTDPAPGNNPSEYASAWVEIISGPTGYTGPTGLASAVQMKIDETEFRFPTETAGIRDYELPAGTYTIGLYPDYFHGDRTCGYADTRTITIVDNNTILELDKNNSGGAVCTGTTGTMIVNAIGTGPFTYQIKPVGAPDSSYSAPQDSNQFENVAVGNYNVKIKGGCISIEPEISMLDIATSHVLTITPSPAVCEGQEAKISVMPIGPISSIVWSFGATPATATPITTGLDATETTLTIASFAAANAGNYYVNVTTSTGCTFTSTVNATLAAPETCGATPTFTAIKTVTDADGDKKAQANEILTYHITVKNTGTVAIPSITISDNIPANTAYVASSASAGGSYDSTNNKVTFSDTAPLAVGASRTYTFDVQVGADLTGILKVSNIATVNGTPTTPEDPENPGNPDPSCTDPANCPTEIPTDGTTKFTAFKSVTDASGDNKAQANEVLAYHIKVTNTGTVAIPSITISDNIPANTAYVASSA
ncbi:DUF11 domain-containing protein, partial [Flavobacterium foetidum]|uniref:DUF11 domain-containing protein n=1 Tax=Flavobacterium foetidum TaxID=2026681 RepID=UPI00107546D6